MIIKFLYNSVYNLIDSHSTIMEDTHEKGTVILDNHHSAYCKYIAFQHTEGGCYGD